MELTERDALNFWEAGIESVRSAGEDDNPKQRFDISCARFYFKAAQAIYTDLGDSVNAKVVGGWLDSMPPQPKKSGKALAL